jgi:hypothetical protein
LLVFYFINDWLGRVVNTKMLPDGTGEAGSYRVCFWGVCFWEMHNNRFSLHYVWYLLTQFSLYCAYPLYLIIRFTIFAWNKLGQEIAAKSK